MKGKVLYLIDSGQKVWNDGTLHLLPHFKWGLTSLFPFQIFLAGLQRLQ